MSKKTALSGVKPSGNPHIGNYFGAMRQFVDLQTKYDCMYFIADYHALTTLKDPKELKVNILNVAIDYLAIGLNPDNVVLYKQSDIAEHTELAWIFESLSTMPYLMRAHAFKDAEAKNKDLNVATFNYPLLMAADILLYDADMVPVGQDQKQHIEIARDMADKFNASYGEVFKSPKELILENMAVVPGIDGQKMSKSYKNTIPLFSTRDEITKAVLSIVTDSGSDIPTNVYAIHKLVKDKKDLDFLYEENKGKYKILKDALIEDLDSFIEPLRQKRNEISADQSRVIEILKSGGEKAKEIARKKMDIVREKIGVKLY